jgi:hypothetical protein
MMDVLEDSLGPDGRGGGRGGGGGGGSGGGEHPGGSGGGGGAEGGVGAWRGPAWACEGFGEDDVACHADAARLLGCGEARLLAYAGLRGGE